MRPRARVVLFIPTLNHGNQFDLIELAVSVGSNGMFKIIGVLFPQSIFSSYIITSVVKKTR